MQVLETGQFVIHSLHPKGVEKSGEAQPASLAHLASALEGGVGRKDEGEGERRGSRSSEQWVDRHGQNK